MEAATLIFTPSRGSFEWLWPFFRSNEDFGRPRNYPARTALITCTSSRSSVVGSSSLTQLPGRWQFQLVLPGRQLVVDLADEEERFIFSRYTTVRISSPRIFGNLVGCQQGPRPQAAQPNREFSVLPPRIAVQYLSGSRQSL